MVSYLLMNKLSPEYNAGTLESLLRLEAQNNKLHEESPRALYTSKHMSVDSKPGFPWHII